MDLAERSQKLSVVASPKGAVGMEGNELAVSGSLLGKAPGWLGQAVGGALVQTGCMPAGRVHLTWIT